MRTVKGKRALRLTIVTLAASLLALPGCGGGGSDGGGGGGGGGPIALSVVSTPNPTTGRDTAVQLGYRDLAGSETVQGIQVAPDATGALPGNQLVAPANTADLQYLIRINFSDQMQADTVLGATPGVVIQQQTAGTGLAVDITDDWSLDPSTFPAPGLTPTQVTLFYDPDDDLTTPDFLLPGEYVMVLRPTVLRSADNQQWTPLNVDPLTGLAQEPLITFSVDADGTQPRVAPINGTSPIQGSTEVSPGAEITITFSEAIDLASLVGVANVSAQDPFCSNPLPMTYTNAQACSGGAQAPFVINGGNLLLNYTPPIDPFSGAFELIPAGCGALVYMPDPLFNPNQIRIRPCDLTLLTANPQNFGHGSPWVPLTDQNGAPLPGLPPVLPYPGSLDSTNPQLTATMDVFIMAVGFVPPPGSVPAGSEMCYVDNGGLQDRSANPIAADFRLTFSYRNGPTPSRNVNFPHATLVGRVQGDKGLSILSTAPITTDLGGAGTQTPAPVTYGTQVTGTMQLMANPLSDPSIVQTPTDLEIGAFIDTTGTNNITNPGFGATAITGVPDTQQGTTPTSLLNLLFMQPVPQQPWGSYVYVVDGDASAVKVVNSYDFSLVTVLTGVPTPSGVGITPDLSQLYVSNRDSGTVTVVDANPLSPFFHTPVNTIQVGAGPGAISITPGNEDAFVANFVENTYSIIDLQTGAERLNLAAGSGPSDIFIANRMLGQGLTNAYLAWITNFFDNTVTIYESDSPAVPNNGPEGKEVANIQGFNGPRSGCWNWQTFITFTQEPGAYIVNTLGTTVDEISLFNFVLGPPPGFPGNPDRRDFRLRKSYDGLTVAGLGNTSPSDATIDDHSGLYNANNVGITNNKTACDPAIGGGVPSAVLISFPGAGTVVAFNYNGTNPIGTVSVPGCNILQSYYDQ